ncbi:hypothetical protein EC973_007710 [Apophysomyces ossiformis]|uniref:Kinesin motor domain-containing protein n=1 Tax=Apophysomyces ossiformis TaxID=679940 RepID=A0A8H7ETC7_9FUNG|nr:hypothetical protein EC973_007710 [Apophysomyces ossiformis]
MSSQTFEQHYLSPHPTPRPSYSRSRPTPHNSTLLKRTPTTSTSTTTTSTMNRHRNLSSTTSSSNTAQNSAENVKVTVRCRPLTQQERLNRSENAWQIMTEDAKIRLALPSRQNIEYHYDHVFYGSDNALLYDASVKNLVK